MTKIEVKHQCTGTALFVPSEKLLDSRPITIDRSIVINLRAQLRAERKASALPVSQSAKEVTNE